YLLVGAPLLLLAAGALGVWQYLAATQERRSLQYALSAADAKGAPRTFGTEGLMALRIYAAQYYLNSQKPNCASTADEQYSKAVALARGQGSAGDALLGDMAVAELDLAGGPDETDTGRKLDWKKSHQLVSATLRAINGREGRLAALRRVTAG